MILIFLICLWVICVSLWSMSIWGGWAEKYWESNRTSNYSWFWLDTFHIEKTKENCVKFLKSVSWAGIIILTLSSLLILFVKSK